MTTRKRTNGAYTYGRKSSPGQNELSFTGQHKDMLQYLEREGLVELEHFEEAASGLDTDNRHNFLRMIDKALDPENGVSHLVFYDLSRFTRSKVDPHFYLDLLDQHDITVHTLLDGKRPEADDLSWDVKFSINHSQSRTISMLTLRGLRDAVEAGYAPNRKIPYGYKRGWITRGNRQHPTYLLHEVHAEHVRMMYRMRDEGRRTAEVCARLFELEIPSPTGLPRWPKGTITKILRNRANIGELHFFKTTKSKFPRNRRRYKPIVVIDAHEPLVSEDVFNRVNESITANNRPGTNSPRSQVSPNPLSESVKCTNPSAHAGEKPPNMIVKTVKGEKVLTCSVKKNYGVAHCRADDVPLDPFLNIIVSELIERALTRDVLEEQIQHINQNSSQLVAEERERQAAIKKRIRAIERETGNLTKSLRQYETSHPIASATLMDELETLGKEKLRLESQSHALNDDVSETLKFATEPEAIIEAALDLGTYLEAEDKSTARTLLTGFIKRVDVADGFATIHYTLPLPDTQETESGHSITVPLDDEEILLEHGTPPTSGL